MTNNGTVILPIAGRASRFPGTRPKWMLTAPTGQLMLELSLSAIPDWRDRRVVIGALREHLEQLGGIHAIRNALGDHPEIVVFEEVTKGPAETVYEILNRASVSGPIFIKDCDSWFTSEANLFENGIAYCDLRDQPNTRNIPGKSFIKLNENGIVEGIFEKVICSNFISVGGYGFNSAEDFCRHYKFLADNWTQGEPFISHVILHAIQSGEIFKGIQTKDYEDVGTLEAWDEFRSRSTLLIVDIDGVVLKNSGEYIPPLWSDPDVPLSENVATLIDLQKRGAQIIFVTARPEKYRLKTEAALRDAGLNWHSIVFGVNHSRRVLINDFAPSNPYPSAVAVNLPRNDRGLGAILNFR